VAARRLSRQPRGRAQRHLTGRSFARDICHIRDSLACYIDWLFPIWDAKRQTFADKIVSTVVIPE
jgi:hypothetical protein